MTHPSSTDAYEELNVKSVVDYVQQVPALRERIGSGPLEAREAGEGNMNVVFLVWSQRDPERALIVKQAVPYVRVAGPEWPLTLDRMRLELAALREQRKRVPLRVPEVFYGDETMAVAVMEYLSPHEILRGPLTRGEQFPRLAEHLAEFMAVLHFSTSDMALSGEEKKHLARQFSNPAMCRLQEDCVFTNPFMDHPQNDFIEPHASLARATWRDWPLKVAIVEIKQTYVTRAQALLHGDLHTGSIMVTPTDTRVIDPEFAFYGPIGYDVGTLLAHLTIAWAVRGVSGDVPTPQVSQRGRMRDLVREVLVRYFERFDELWRNGCQGHLASGPYWADEGGEAAFGAYRADVLTGILQDSAGHAGCEILRRILGIVTVPELSEIEDISSRAGLERELHRIARTWLVDRSRIRSVDDLLATLEEPA